MSTPCFAVLSILAALSGQADAQCHQTEVLTGAGHTGSSLAASETGDVLVVGAPTDVVSGTANGSALVSRDGGATWTPLAMPPGASAGMRFGHAVAIDDDGDTLVVGAPGDDTGASDGGRVDVYEWNAATQTWDRETGLVGSGAGSATGSSVDISGERIIAGSPAPGEAGEAVILLRTAPATWSIESTLTASEVGDAFGFDVAIDDDFAVVGSPDAGGSQGRVRFYERSGATWNLVTTWGGVLFGTPSIGQAVAIDGDHAVALAPAESELFFFRRNATTGTWGAVQTFSFGVFESQVPPYTGDVALQGDRALFGTPDSNSPQLPAGAGLVRRFEFGSSWSPVFSGTFARVDARVGDAHGSAVALAGSRAIVGAPGRASSPGQLGAVATYDIDFSVDLVDLGQGLAGTFGEPGVAVAGSGCGNASIQLTASDLFGPSEPLWFVLGFGTLEAPFKGGVLVPTPDVVVGPLSTFGTNLGFSQLWPADLPSVSFGIQVWRVDDGGPVGFSASDGLLVTTAGD